MGLCWYAHECVFAVLEVVTLEYFSGYAPDDEGEFSELNGLLESSSLRSMEFSKFKFTSGASWALLAAFEGGASVTNLLFTNCSCHLVNDVDGFGTIRVMHEDDDLAGAIRALVRVL
jgi:hypothetical protein